MTRSEKDAYLNAWVKNKLMLLSKFERTILDHENVSLIPIKGNVFLGYKDDLNQYHLIVPGTETLDSDTQVSEKKVFEKRFNHFSEQHVLFYVANMHEPGTFESIKIDSLQMNGLTFIMQLPVAIDGIKALNIMLQLSQDISERLKGVVLDEERNILTAKSIKENLTDNGLILKPLNKMKKFN